MAELQPAIKSDIHIEVDTWQALLLAHKKAGWTEKDPEKVKPGVFATAVGSEYSKHRLLYVGKSAGALGDDVHSTYVQQESANASLAWMLDPSKNPKSHFWRFIDSIVEKKRERIAWSNISRMDPKKSDKPKMKNGEPKKDSGKPPCESGQWPDIRESCIAALKQEIEALKPKVALFATSCYCMYDVVKLITDMGYRFTPLSSDITCTSQYKSPEGRFVIMTRHPQGWKIKYRLPVVKLVKTLLVQS